MRVIVAGLFLYIGMMIFIGLTVHTGWTDKLSPYAFVIAAAAVILALAFAAHHVFNRRSPPPALSGIDEEAAWHFKFVNSASELLTAERAERRERSGMNAFFQGLVILVGLVWITLPFFVVNPDTELWRPVLSVILGLLVLRSFLVKPILVRWRIQRAFASPKAVDVEIRKSGIHVATNGEVERWSWEQLAGILPTPEGIVFYWEDGTKNWLPASAIGSDSTAQRLITFVTHHVGATKEP